MPPRKKAPKTADVKAETLVSAADSPAPKADPKGQNPEKTPQLNKALSAGSVSTATGLPTAPVGKQVSSSHLDACREAVQAASAHASTMLSGTCGKT